MKKKNLKPPDMTGQQIPIDGEVLPPPVPKTATSVSSTAHPVVFGRRDVKILCPMTKKCGSLHPPNVVLSATALVQPKTSSRLAPNLVLDQGIPIFWKQSLAKYCRIGLVHPLSPEVLASSYLKSFFSVGVLITMSPSIWHKFTRETWDLR